MKRRRAEKRHEISPTPRRLRHAVYLNIPLDVTVEILKKLPTKSLVRFQCVSKLWSSIISRCRDFIDSIVTRSSTQPPRDAHLLYQIYSGHNVECDLAFSSSNCPRITDKESLLLIPTDLLQYVRGLICCWSDSRKEAAMYNLTTRQSFHLPKIETLAMGMCYFGHDPLENQYKALFIPISYYTELTCQVFTLGDPAWRTIQGVKSHYPLFGAVCINGTIYYRARTTRRHETTIYKLMSFDVRSEEFCHVDAPDTLMNHFSFLTNYLGKLGFVCCENVVEVWVKEDGDQKTKR